MTSWQGYCCCASTDCIDQLQAKLQYYSTCSKPASGPSGQAATHQFVTRIVQRLHVPRLWHAQT